MNEFTPLQLAIQREDDQEIIRVLSQEMRIEPANPDGLTPFRFIAQHFNSGIGGNESLLIEFANYGGLRRELDAANSFEKIRELGELWIQTGPMCELLSAQDSEGKPFIGKMIELSFQHNRFNAAQEFLERINYYYNFLDVQDSWWGANKDMLLHFAVRNYGQHARYAKNYKKCNRLISLFYDPKAASCIFEKNKSGVSPLHLACEEGNEWCVQYLLSGYVKFDASACKEGFNASVVSLYDLFQHRFNSYCNEAHFSEEESFAEEFKEAQEQSPSPMDIAIRKNRLGVVKLLVAVNYPLHIKNSEGQTPLEVAQQTDNPGIIGFLEKAEFIDGFIRNSEELDEEDLCVHLLRNAESRGFIFLVEECGLRFKAEQCKSLWEDDSCIFSLLATTKTRSILLKTYKKAEANIDIQTKYTMLHRCVLERNSRGLKFLLEIYNADTRRELWLRDQLHILRKNDFTAFLEDRKNFKETCETFLRIEDDNHKNLLDLAIDDNQTDIINILLAAGSPCKPNTFLKITDDKLKAKIIIFEMLEENNHGSFIGMLQEFSSNLISEVCRLMNYTSYPDRLLRTEVKSAVGKFFQEWDNECNLLSAMANRMGDNPDEPFEEFFKLIVCNIRACRLLSNKLEEEKNRIQNADSDEDSHDDSEIDLDDIIHLTSRFQQAVIRKEQAPFNVGFWMIEQGRRDPNCLFFHARIPRDNTLKIAGFLSENKVDVTTLSVRPI